MNQYCCTNTTLMRRLNPLCKLINEFRHTVFLAGMMIVGQASVGKVATLVSSHSVSHQCGQKLESGSAIPMVSVTCLQHPATGRP